MHHQRLLELTTSGGAQIQLPRPVHTCSTSRAFKIFRVSLLPCVVKLSNLATGNELVLPYDQRAQTAGEPQLVLLVRIYRVHT